MAAPKGLSDGADQMQSELDELLARACPDKALLAGIDKSLRLAEKDPESEYFPYLDPDRFWYEVAWKRASGVIERCDSVIASWVSTVGDVLVEADHVLQDVVTTRAWDENGDRTAVVDEVVMRCESIHNSIEMAVDQPLDRDPIGAIETILTSNRSRRGTIDGESLRSQTPWRQQELLVEAHRKAYDGVEAHRRQAGAELLGRLMPMGERAITTYDTTSAGQRH